MEVFTFTPSFFTFTPSLKSLTKRTHLKLHKTHLKPFLNPTKTPIFSRFNRPSKRRNSLRKKLSKLIIPKDPEFNNPVHHFVDSNISELNLDLDSNLDSGNSNFDSGNSKKTEESELWNKLENWVELYKRDIEFWGIGSNPIFTVFYDASNGKVDSVFVDEDEILRRNGVDLKYYKEMSEVKEGNFEFSEVNSKINYARVLAKELESGKDVINRGSSVAKFVVSGFGRGLISKVRGVVDRGSYVAKVGVSRVRSVCVSNNAGVSFSRVGFGVVCGVLVVWVVRKLLGFERRGVEVSRVEEEMLRRKMKARAKEGGKVEKGSVEIVEDEADVGLSGVVIKRPRFDKDAVLDGIRKVKGLSGDLDVVAVGGGDGGSNEMDFKVKEIQTMAKRAREIEAECLDDGNLRQPKDESLEVVVSNGFDDLEKQSSVVLPVIEDTAINNVSNAKLSESVESINGDDKFHDEEASEGVLSDVKKPVRRMPKIIRSVKEAREYLSHKNDKYVQMGDVSAIAAATNEGIHNYVGRKLGKDEKGLESSDVDRILDRDSGVEEMKDGTSILIKEPQVGITPLSNLETGTNSNVDIELNLGRKKDGDGLFKHTSLCETFEAVSDVNDDLSSPKLSNKVDVETPKPSDLSEKSNLVPNVVSSYDADNSRGVSDTDDERARNLNARSIAEREIPVPIHAEDDLNGSSSKETAFIPAETNGYENVDNKNYVESMFPSADTSLGSESGAGNKEGKLFADKESWLEKNFHEMEPILYKMGAGLRDGYMVAREKAKQDVSPKLDFMELSSSLNDDTELEWMKDDKLREIVFKVRDNELAGRDPFHLMDVDDKNAFLEGLESKVEKESQKLAPFHQWLHSNIENLDYGADGISIYDPPEKFVPRWKGPPIDEFVEFFINGGDQQQKASSSLQKGVQSTKHNDTGTSQEASTTKPRPVKKIAKFPKTVIESSDGSVKPGKKSGKEYWHHTKKRTRGFLEVYNAETDPEVKAIMRDMGKDLDRWITEKEIQEAADIIDRFPQKGREFIEKKMSKIKRQMELFGPQAVVSKYREYSDQKEEDYLWWLDLPHALCIEMYIYEGENQEIGFYTLEMAADLELEPKPQHLIAFQDPGDCKNFCYILQAHLEMLNKGNAFVVPQHPKDIYQQAKASGFGVTVIRRGEVKPNIDQPLEEVEQLIAEIGTKMYYDAIMRERSIDVSSVIKGAFGVNKPTRRRKKQELK